MLTERRKAAGLTRKQLSAMSGVSLRTLEQWEKYGVWNGTFKNVLKVADALELYMEQLITDQYDEFLMIEVDDEDND